LTDINNISRNTGVYMVRYFLNVISDHTKKQSYDLRSPRVDKTTLEAKSNINPNASVGAPNPGTNGTHTKILDFDSK